MRISPEALAAESEATGFGAHMLEKSVRLLALLDAIRDHPLLDRKLALKGGTALNLFVFRIPRLSVDIDLNYVGTASRDVMLKERPAVERAIRTVCGRENLTVRRVPTEHAGGKWSLRYASADGQSGRLEVDLNFMHRVPLWPIAKMNSHPLGIWRATRIPVVDVHELAAGKLVALLSRRKARDLFDSRSVLTMDGIDRERLRLAFVVYGAMSRNDWRKVAAEDVCLDVAELVGQLVPTLHAEALRGTEDAAAFGRTLVDECRRELSAVLPFTEAERAFLDLLLDRGQVDASILTSERDLQERIQAQPMLEWKALHVRRRKGVSHVEKEWHGR